jgi:membrane dipeptidase
VRRVDSKIVPLSKTEEERFEDLLEKCVMISLHDHTKVYPEDPDLMRDYIRSGRIFVGYEGLSVSGLDAVFEALHDGTGSIEAKDPWDWDNIVYQIGMYLADIDKQDFVFLGKRVEDIKKAHETGRLASILSIEAIPNIGSNLDKIDVMYGFGVRCMGLAYSHGNAFCSGLAEKNDNGITDLGYAAIRRMNKLGITVDLSHVSDKSRLQAIEASKKPVFITHAGARALWPSRRLVTDEALHELAEKNGVIGIEAAPHTTITMNRRRHSLDSVMEHFEYISKLIGTDHVAFGPDTNFGDHVGLHKRFAKELSTSATKEQMPPYEEVEYVDGLENPSEFHNIVRWLVKHGYSDQDIEKVVGQNIMRVLAETW